MCARGELASPLSLSPRPASACTPSPRTDPAPRCTSPPAPRSPLAPSHLTSHLAYISGESGEGRPRALRPPHRPAHLRTSPGGDQPLGLLSPRRRRARGAVRRLPLAAPAQHLRLPAAALAPHRVALPRDAELRAAASGDCRLGTRRPLRATPLHATPSAPPPSTPPPPRRPLRATPSTPHPMPRAKPHVAWPAATLPAALRAALRATPWRGVS